MIGFLVRGRVRVKIRIRVRVGVMFKVSVYHWSNCRRSKCRTFDLFTHAKSLSSLIAPVLTEMPLNISIITH